MTITTRSALAVTRYVPHVTSVRSARRFVESTLAEHDLAWMADDAGLMTSELAANAVLHARTDFDVTVHELPRGARVTVRDRCQAPPVLVAPSTTAMSGRGLALVQTLATQWGTDPTPPSGKEVWFELDETGGPAAGEPGDVDVDALLAGWAEDVVVPTGGAHPLQVPSLPAEELLQAEEQLDGVLRDLQLVLLGGELPGGASEQEMALARRLDEAARRFDDVRRQVRVQVGHAVAVGEQTVELRLDLPPDAASRARAFREAAAATLGRHDPLREVYLQRVISG